MPVTLESPPEEYRSSLASDPDLSELVALFVEEMPDRVRDLQTQFQLSDWDQLARLAHQLKGAAGSYGFDQITPFAAALETTIRSGEPVVRVRDAFQQLVLACCKVRFN